MIKGQRVYLRAIREDDIDRIARCFQNEEIMYMTGTRNIFTKEHIKEAIQRFKEDASRYDFAICSVSNTEVILRQALFMNNAFSDGIIMSMLRDEYLNKK
ncbi:GNAT family N-acetyltransferase [Lysinibacillus sp. OF-1]|uniref:GNAT family N-acetyltransferase n=1 Tax=Lysinibacillus sp. OF-1 TaxID=2972483 RepID=UPI00232EDD85|nr:GNAT family N-acetyltransferase [Lysinibacillus sp. OF-1]WCH47587.1 GNAT family N-acetyltransferase [Lysinibacillus sp. OF-1]